MASGANYTVEDDEQILSCIIKCKAYYALKGNLFWKHLEEKNVVPGRTWQGLKERFHKRIYKKLAQNLFPSIELEEQKLIHLALIQMDIEAKSQTRKPATITSTSTKPKEKKDSSTKTNWFDMGTSSEDESEKQTIDEDVSKINNNGIDQLNTNETNADLIESDESSELM